MRNNDKDKIKTVSVITATGLVLAMGIYLLFFGPLAILDTTRVDSIYSTNLKFVQMKGSGTPTVKEKVLRGSELQINYMIKGPSYFRVGGSTQIRILGASLRLTGHGELTNYEKASEHPFTLLISIESGSCPFGLGTSRGWTAPVFKLESRAQELILFTRSSYKFLWVPFKDLSQKHKLTFKTAGVKKLCYKISWHQNDETHLGEMLVGQTDNWFEVAPASVAINLWLSRIAVLLALLATPLTFDKLFDHLYSLYCKLRDWTSQE